MQQLSLTVDSILYQGWIRAEVTRSLDTFAHSFRLDYVDRWTDSQAVWPIRAQAQCQLKYGNHILVTGYIDRSSFKVDADSWTLSASGRSYTGDLVDASAIYKTGVWRNKTAFEIANDLVAPYGLEVTRSTPDPQPIRRFSIEEGESVYNALERLVKNRGYLLHTLADGNVSMMQLQQFVGVVGQAPINTAIERSFDEDYQDRYSEYHTMSQSYGEDEDGDAVTVHRTFDGVVDEGVRRYRPLKVVADSATDRDGLERRAKWERNIRAGRSERYEATFPDILDERGFTWTPGDRHHVVDEAFGLDAEMVVVEARIEVEDKKVETTVQFARPEAYSLLEFPDTILNVVTKKGRPKVKKARVPFPQKGNPKR